MRIGYIGLGKLGLPCALASESKGHTVFGIDPSQLTKEIIENKKLAYLEEGAQELLNKSNICLVSYEYIVKNADIIFVAVQTPHDPRFEGITPITDERCDFNYSFLCSAIDNLCIEIKKHDIIKTVVVISTVLPGTMKKYVRPILEKNNVEKKINLVYNPYFIAMGTTIENYLFPEFTLLGTDTNGTAEKVKNFYKTIHPKPVFTTTVENAELIKVTYNTFIGMKIAFANTVMEICHKIPNTDCDSIIDALSIADDRIISPKYLRGGMGDGGGCHPRDNIALSWLARELKLSHDFFNDIMISRQNQTKWLVDLIKEQMKGNNLPVYLLGIAYKPNTNISIGSPAKLLSFYLNEDNIIHKLFDPYVNKEEEPNEAAIYFVSTRHQFWKTFNFPLGSIVIDPFRYLEKNESIKNYIAIGGEK